MAYWKNKGSDQKRRRECLPRRGKDYKLKIVLKEFILFLHIVVTHYKLKNCIERVLSFLAYHRYILLSWFSGFSRNTTKLLKSLNSFFIKVEAILSQHPGVAGVVTVGILDSRLSEMVVACIQLRRDWQWTSRSFEHSTAKQKELLSHEILQQFCKQNNLARYCSPFIIQTIMSYIHFCIQSSLNIFLSYIFQV